MKTYMISPVNREDVVTVLKAVNNTVSKDPARPLLQGFHVVVDGDCNALYVTDGFRLLKWVTDYPILLSEGTEDAPGGGIQTGTYKIVTLDPKNALVVLENIDDEGIYPDCDVIFEGAEVKENATPSNKIAFNPKLLYDMTKYFKDGVILEWRTVKTPCWVRLLRNDIEGLTMLIMPMHMGD